MRACVLHSAEDLRVEQRPDAALAGDEVRIRFGAGGICGSDLHYYFEGRVGDFEVREPLILGHEMAGEVAEVGPQVRDLRVGQRVAVNPSHPCRHCRFCRGGMENLCSRMRFLGSASVMPHVQGAFQETFVTRERQCVVLPPGMDYGIAAFGEPLAVSIHAVNRAGALLGKHVLITGCGPIGALILLVARRAGAASVTMTDVADGQLEAVRRLGADETVNVDSNQRALEPFRESKGRFDVALEASGAVSAIETCIDCTRPGGRVVQVGMLPPGMVPVPVNKVMAKEIDFVGSFRFHHEFDTAVAYLVEGLIDVAPLLSGQFDASDADRAFHAAAARNGTMKVQIVF